MKKPCANVCIKRNKTEIEMCLIIKSFCVCVNKREMRPAYVNCIGTWYTEFTSAFNF